LNDEEFIREFVAAKSKSKNWSLRRIKSELVKRGIDSKQIDLVFKDQTDDSDQKNAAMLAKKKYESLLTRGLNPNELKNKLYSYLLSKGFDYELVKEICNKIVTNEEEK
jgi:regulatory protein